MNTISARSGFVLPVVLGIILLAALFAVQSATELGNTSLLAAQRLLHQRAFEAGESGIIAVLDQLESGTDPAPRQQLQSTEVSADSATVESRLIARLDLPNGYSAGRIFETRYEVRSTGHSARAAEVTVVQGVRQLRAGPAP